jgi:phosphotransferase system  glucose/maltose/N-acetylglucosamine-specific IIC component
MFIINIIFFFIHALTLILFLIKKKEVKEEIKEEKVKEEIKEEKENKERKKHKKNKNDISKSNAQIKSE